MSAQPGGNDQLAQFLSDYGLPAGFGIAALICFILAAATDTPGFGVIGFGLFIGGGVIVARKASAVGNTQTPRVALSMTPVPDQVRQQNLQQYLSTDVAQTRGRIESVTPYSAVVVTGQRVNHVLHLLVSVLLCGLWLPVWALVAASGGEKRHVIAVDVCGNVTRS